MKLFLRWLLVLSVTLFSSLVHGAGLDPETDKPYKLDVVLSLGKHRLLTDVFREQIERELSDGLQAGAGDLVEVRVLRTHPLLKEVEKKGLAEAIKEFKAGDDTKTHVVRIDYIEGEYEVQAQQYDAMTGMLSPVLRKKRTSDRQFVARLATLFIAQDFGPIATVIDGKDENNVKIQFKAAQKGKLERWVSKGELLVLVTYTQGAKGPRSVPDAVLQLESQDKQEGVWIAKLYRRYANPLTQTNLVGVRCMRIATVKTALKVRVVHRDAKQLTPASGLGVEIRKNSFDDKTDKVEKVTDREGYVRLSTEYNRLVFLTLQVQPNKALIPVPLVDDEPVTVSVIVRQDNRSLLALRRHLWEQQVTEANAAQGIIFKELEALNAKAEQREQAIEAARKGVENAEQVWKELDESKNKLRDDAERAGEKLDLSFGNQFLERIKNGKKEFEDYIVAQEKIIKEEIPKQKKHLEQIEQAKRAEFNADFEKALAIYAEVVKDGIPDDGVKKHYDGLKAAWEPKNAAHKAAKKYIFETWGGVELSKLKDALDEARKALKVCRDNKDKLTPQRFLQESLGHAPKIEMALLELRPDLQEEDQKKKDELLELSKGIRGLIDEARKDLGS